MLGARNRLALTISLGLTALGLCVGLVVPAEAAIGVVRAKLTISPLGSNYQVSVTGVVKMLPTEAQGLIDSGHKIVVRVWGEDPISDDLLLGPYHLTRTNGHLRVSTQGLVFNVSAPATRSRLDEDYAPGTTGIHDFDDVYAGVRLVASNGTTMTSGETNRQGRVNFENVGQVPESYCRTNYVDC